MIIDVTDLSQWVVTPREGDQRGRHCRGLYVALVRLSKKNEYDGFPFHAVWFRGIITALRAKQLVRRLLVHVWISLMMMWAVCVWCVSKGGKQRGHPGVQAGEENYMGPGQTRRRFGRGRRSV